MAEHSRNTKLKAPAWWTPLLVFVIIHVGSRISLLTQHDLSVSDFYLPSAISIVLIYWFGPLRVTPVVFINSVVTSPLWGNAIEDWPYWFLYAIPETVFGLCSWLIFIKFCKGKYWFPNIRNVVLFLVAGISIPAIIEIFLLQSMLLWTGAQALDTYWKYIASNLLGEFAPVFFLTLPALYYITPLLRKKINLPGVPVKIPAIKPLPQSSVAEILAIFTLLIIITFSVDFKDFWFVYGLLSLYVAIRFGFGPAISTNFYILLLIYVMPKVLNGFGENDVGNYLDVMNVFLGACLLSVFAAITGRVMSDMKNAEAKLMKKNTELEKANKELDHYVYSVSHDLSAPLKSILGLVNISRLTTSRDEHLSYIDRIEKSVKKLEAFIAEILDYSRNKRQKLIIEAINLQELCQEILENLLDPDQPPVKVHFNLTQQEVYQDRTRLKIIMNNLLSNAIKFQRSIPQGQGYIIISSYQTNDDVSVIVEDNGEGIKQDHLKSVFKMFHRGSIRSEGSGLGLYIAKEAVAKIGGNISVTSEHGKGSKFKIDFKSRNPKAE